MEWITTVVVELHSGTSLKIDDTVTYRCVGNEYTGVIQSFLPGNKMFSIVSYRTLIFDLLRPYKIRVRFTFGLVEVFFWGF